MWADLQLVVEMALNLAGQVFSLYTTYGFLSLVLSIWIVRRVLKTFNIL